MPWFALESEVLSSADPFVEVSAIDGFQGREAETVQLNASNDIGYLTDTRGPMLS